MTAEKSVNVLVLCQDWRLSVALLAATNRKQFQQNAERKKINILEICLSVTNVVEDEHVPVDICMKFVNGLIEIYRFNVQSLKRTLTFKDNGRISFKRKEVNEIEVTIKTKSKKLTFDAVPWDPDNDIVLEDRIIERLLSNKDQTSVRNIEDITIREAPLKRKYSIFEDDDFGQPGEAEIDNMFFLDFEQKRISDEWVSNDLTLHDSEIAEPYASTNENSCNILPPIPEENFHMCEEIELEQLSVPNESANLAEAEHENIVVAKPPISGLSNNPICEEIEMVQLSVCNPICEEIELMQQSVCNESANLTEAEHDSVVVSARKTVSYRSTKLSITCMEQSFENYWKYQRKRPRDELQHFITTYNAEQLHCKPLRYCIKSVLFARFPKIKRPQIKENHELLLKEFGMQSKRSRKQQESEPAVEPTTDNAVQEPTTLVNDVPCNMPTNEIAHVDPVPDNVAQETTFFSESNVQDKQSYVSEDEVLGLLQHLWTEVPNEVPFQMIDVHIKNRRMAASVFMHQLDFCAKQIIGVVKDDNGAPKSFIKGPNWSFE